MIEHHFKMMALLVILSNFWLYLFETFLSQFFKWVIALHPFVLYVNVACPALLLPSQWSLYTTGPCFSICPAYF